MLDWPPLPPTVLASACAPLPPARALDSGFRAGCQGELMHRKSSALTMAAIAAALVFAIMALHPQSAMAGCGAADTKAAETKTTDTKAADAKPAASEAPKLAIGAKAPAFSLMGT